MLPQRPHNLTFFSHNFLPVRTRTLFILLLCGFLMTPRVNASERSESGTNQLVTGAACFIVTPVYGAFKLAFAGVGAIVGGITWVFSGGDSRTSQKIWDTSLKGTYIITPDHLKGRKRVNFIGPS